jgi:hypothetical protein
VLCGLPDFVFLAVAAHKVAALPVLDLQRQASDVARDDGDALVQGFGDLDLEALAGGQLQGDARARQQRVEHLVAWAEAHDDDAVLQVAVGVLELGQDVVEDCRAVRVVDAGMAAEDELGGLLSWLALAVFGGSSEKCSLRREGGSIVVANGASMRRHRHAESR